MNVGSYEVSASLPGFQTVVRSGITLTIGREAVVDITLSVGEITERVNVIGEAPRVETTSGSLGDVVDRQTILELPLNGRNLTTLITMQAGVVGVLTRSGSRSGYAQRVSISGARPQDNSILMDGTETKAFEAGGVPSGISGNFLGAEGVQEFKVERNSFSAAFGGIGGGAVNVVSKSGTNAFHGSVYELHRNDNLDASAWADQSLADGSGNFIGKAKPEFKRHQFGASLGGPIVTNKTFFFANYEALRETRGQTVNLNVMDLNARNGLIPNEDTGVLEPVFVDPDIPQYFVLWPEPGPNAEDLGDGTAREKKIEDVPINENYFQVRIDHQISDSDSLFGRYTYSDSERHIRKTISVYNTVATVDNTFLTVEERKIFSPTLLNLFRFGFNRRGNGQDSFENPATPTALHFVRPADWKAPRGAVPAIGGVSCSGSCFSPIGLGATSDGWLDFHQNNTQFIDDVTYNRGAHSLKFGVNFLRIKFTLIDTSRVGGNFSFSNLEDFLAADPNRFRGDILVGSTPDRDLRHSIVGFYIQDDWQAHPQLTLNLGFRYEFATVPTEKNGKVANLRQPFTQGLTTEGDPWFENPFLKAFMPRIGLAWDPTGSGKTAIRMGGGIFYNHMPTETYRASAVRTPPFAWEIDLRSRNFGTIPFPGTELFDEATVARANDPNGLGFGAPRITIYPFDWGRNPHMIQWNMNIQHEVLPQTAVTIGYAGSRGINLIRSIDINVPEIDRINGRWVLDPAVHEAPNQFWAASSLRTHDMSANSFYHSLQTELQRRFQDGFQFQFSYTWSRTIDEDSSFLPTFSNDGGGHYYWDPQMRRGLAAYHVAHTSTSNFVWQLPVGQGQRFGSGWGGIADGILGGWQLSSLFTLSSGPADTISKSSRRNMSGLFLPDGSPDQASGSNNPVLENWTPDKYFDTSDFDVPPDNTIGNVGRNTLIGPGVANFDLSLSKAVHVREEVDLKFKTEVFNLFNRPNFDLPDTSVFTRTGRTRSTTGHIDDTLITARQIQFTLRLEF